MSSKNPPASTAARLYLHEAGDPSASAILFLHGTPLSGRMWLSQLERLPEFHCLAPDLPGHGQSASIHLDLSDTVRRLVDLIRDSTPNGKAHLVGLSFGGVVAQALMVAAPEVVDHVILSGTGTRMNRLLVSLSKLNEPVLRLLSPEQLAALISIQFGIPAQFRQLMGEDIKAFSYKTLSRVLESYLDIETPTSTGAPTLVAVGEKETLYARQAARRLSRSIPGAKGVLVSGFGHVWNLEAPDLFAQTVRAWVTNAPLPAGLAPIE